MRWQLYLIILMCVTCAHAQTHQSEYQVRVLAQDGTWTWYNDERCIVDGNAFIIGSMDSQGYSRVDVVPLRESGSVTSQGYRLSTWQSKDDHNNPALIKLANGQLLAAYAKHHVEPVWYWRFADIKHSTVGTQLNWGPQHEMAMPAKTTYNNLFQLSDEDNCVLNFVRSAGFNPNVMISEDQGKTWTEPVVLIKSGGNGTRPYVKYFSNNIDRIDFLYTDGHPRNEPNNSVYHLYYQQGVFKKSDGTSVKTLDELKTSPLVPSDGTRIYDGSAGQGRGWVWDFEYDAQGQPVAVYINAKDHEVGNDLRYRYARWHTETQSWTEQQIAYAGTHLYVPENHYAGGIAIDPENINTVYISADVNPVNGERLPSGHYQIFLGKTKDQGKTWQWQQMTFDQDVDNLRPISPRHHGCDICVIWFQGQYKTYTDFKTRVVGIVE